jgi:hypothetical protein
MSSVPRTPLTREIIQGVITPQGIIHMVDDKWIVSANLHNQEYRPKRQRIEEPYPICQTNDYACTQPKRD